MNRTVFCGIGMLKPLHVSVHTSGSHIPIYIYSSYAILYNNIAHTMAAELALGASHIACPNQHNIDDAVIRLVWVCISFFLVQTFLCDIKSWKYNMPATDSLCNRTT